METSRQIIEEIKADLYAEPTNPFLLAELAESYVQAGNLTEGIATYQEVIRLDPDDADWHFNLGVALKQAGAIQEAIAAYRKAIEIDPQQADFHYSLGNALKAAGDREQAISELQTALTLEPGFVNAA